MAEAIVLRQDQHLPIFMLVEEGFPDRQAAFKRARELADLYPLLGVAGTNERFTDPNTGNLILDPIRIVTVQLSEDYPF